MSRIATPQFEPDGPETCVNRCSCALCDLMRCVVSAIRSPAVWIPLLLLAATTALFRCTDLDMALVRPFYVNGGADGQSMNHWPLCDLQPWKALYDWGVYPAWIMGCGGFALWIASFRWPKLEAWRDPGLFYGLVLILGPGILVNGVLKPSVCRPRPNALVSFGGEREFLPIWKLGYGPEEASFPSGHASMGFYLMAPAFVYYRRRPWLALGFLLLGIVSGGVIGLARMVAGGHFPSDVIWAGGFVYFTALIIAIPFRFAAETPLSRTHPPLV